MGYLCDFALRFYFYRPAVVFLLIVLGKELSTWCRPGHGAVVVGTVFYLPFAGGKQSRT